MDDVLAKVDVPRRRFTVDEYYRMGEVGILTEAEPDVLLVRPGDTRRRHPPAGLRAGRTRDPLSTFRASQALWLHMRRVRPDWPSDEDRGSDLAHHVALKQAIDSAASVFATAARR